MGFARQPSPHVIAAAEGRRLVTIHRLVDAPISLDTARAERARKVADMAKIVLADGTYPYEIEAKRSLMRAGFSSFEIHILIDDVRQTAMQHVVAMEMSES